MRTHLVSSKLLAAPPLVFSFSLLEGPGASCRPCLPRRGRTIGKGIRRLTIGGLARSAYDFRDPHAWAGGLGQGRTVRRHSRQGSLRSRRHWHRPGRLPRPGMDITARTDISDEMLRPLPSDHVGRLTEPCLLRADALAHPLPDKRFDTVVTSTAMYSGSPTQCGPSRAGIECCAGRAAAHVRARPQPPVPAGWTLDQGMTLWTRRTGTEMNC